MAALILSSITSLAAGTSWGTAGTAGIAMMRIGEGLGIPAPITAGAVIFGFTGFCMWDNKNDDKIRSSLKNQKLEEVQG